MATQTQCAVHCSSKVASPWMNYMYSIILYRCASDLYNNRVGAKHSILEIAFNTPQCNTFSSPRVFVSRNSILNTHIEEKEKICEIDIFDFVCVCFFFGLIFLLFSAIRVRVQWIRFCAFVTCENTHWRPHKYIIYQTKRERIFKNQWSVA